MLHLLAALILLLSFNRPAFALDTLSYFIPANWATQSVVLGSRLQLSYYVDGRTIWRTKWGSPTELQRYHYDSEWLYFDEDRTGSIHRWFEGNKWLKRVWSVGESFRNPDAIKYTYGDFCALQRVGGTRGKIIFAGVETLNLPIGRIQTIKIKHPRGSSYEMFWYGYRMGLVKHYNSGKNKTAEATRIEYQVTLPDRSISCFGVKP